MSVSTPNLWELRAHPQRVRDSSQAWRTLADAVRKAQSTVDDAARSLVGAVWTGTAADTYHEHRGRMVRDSADLADAMTEIANAYNRVSHLLEAADHELSRSLDGLLGRMSKAGVWVRHIGDEMVFETVSSRQEDAVVAEVSHAKQVRSRLDSHLEAELRRIQAQCPLIENAGRAWAPIADGSGPGWTAPRAATGVRVIETATGVIISGDGSSDRITVSDGKVTVNGVDHAIPAGKRLTVLGGGGNDRIDVTPGVDAPVTVVGGGGDDTITYAGGDSATIVGNAGNDTIDTTRSGGDNWISGGRGRDRVEAGAGDDRIYGGLGDDTIVAGGGGNWVAGGDGDDRIDSGDGVDFIAGDGGWDTIRAGGGDNWVSGGDGNDRIESGDGVDMLFGDGGRDTILAGAGHDFVHGGGGHDVIDGGDGGGSLYGDAGDDRIQGGGGEDAIYGGGGHDTIRTGGGRDEILGGAGNDHISAAGDHPGVVQAGHRISGGDGNDTIVGGHGADEISGGDGHDNIWGHRGSDLIRGGSGNDTIDAGSGSDNVDGGDGNDTIIGGPGDDTIHGRAGHDDVRGGSGDDYIDGGAGNDSLAGGAGRDVVYGLDGVDRISGGDGNDYLEGGRGADAIDGGAGNDVISGGRGADTLRGGSGSDSIYAGEGVDTVDGGDGWDKVFVHDEDRASNAEHTFSMQQRAFGSGLTVEGSDEFRNRVEADLDMLASSSPAGQAMLGEMDAAGDVVIRESYQDRTFHHGGRIGYDPSDKAGYLPATSLFHEMAHAYDFANGTTAWGVYEGTDTHDGPFPGAPNSGINNDERVAVGLPIDHDADPQTPEIQDPRHPPHLTENALREEMSQPPRQHYRSQ